MTALRACVAVATMLASACITTTACRAEIVDQRVFSRGPVAYGQPMGAAGPYERIHQIVRYAIDPRSPANAGIVDLALAPRDRDGKVVFDGDVEILQPQDARKGNGTVVLEIPNRGWSDAFGAFSAGPEQAEFDDVGDRFLFEHGFTVVLVGWQYNVQPWDGLGLRVPSVPVSATVRSDFINETAHAIPAELSLPRNEAACAADAGQPRATLTVRDAFDARARAVPRAAWRFGHRGGGGFVADPCYVTIDGGLAPGKIYEVSYGARSAALASLGYAAVREIASRYRYPRRTDAQHVIAFGYSQGARYLRSLLYRGFLKDEQSRPVFDGMMIVSAGAGRGSFEHRFAGPGQAGNSVGSVLQPVDIPPFDDAGLLANAHRLGTVPKLMSVFTSTEYWARAGSLVHASTDGKRDLPLDADHRLYFIAGTQHYGEHFPPVAGGDARYLDDPGPKHWAFRALLMDLKAWIDAGTAPPASQYPTIGGGQLVDAAALRAPRIPGFAFPHAPPPVWQLDFGPRFDKLGIIDREPPALGTRLHLLVPAIDASGNETSGIRLPHVDVPLGTFTGWNISIPALPKLGYLDGLRGSFVPFAATADAARKAADDRMSVAERYASRDAYVAQVRASADRLAAQRFVLPDDVPAIVAEQSTWYDWVVRR